jgi:ATPase subunit of ABC transporter with duplicated ATPase domains
MQSVAWLEKTLAAFQGTVCAVTHDRSLPSMLRMLPPVVFLDA